MLNTRDLEERWLRYKIKSYIPHLIITISSIIIIIVLSIFLNSNKEAEKVLVNHLTIAEQNITNKDRLPKPITTNPSIKQQTIQVKKVNIEENTNFDTTVAKQNTSNNSNRSLKLQPSLDFMKKMQHSSLPYYQDEVIVEEKVNTKEPVYTSQIVEEVQELSVQENIQTETIEGDSKKISIKRRDSQDDIRHIIKRFKKNNNPALSLFIAKRYYELGEYHKAYNYALITNEIDRDIDASWLVFAKSLVKLDQKEMAIKTLKQHIENSHSSSAKILLDEISSGKFK